MQRKSGFTIIELLVSIIIIGLLTSAAVANYLTAQRNARDNARKASVNGLSNAIETYYAANRTFPGFIGANPGDDGEPLGGAGFYNSTHGNSCQSIDIDYGNTYLYSYAPRSGTNSTLPSCTTYPAVQTTKGTQLYDPTQYNPLPTWIPGLGEFMNPMPVEKKFLYKDGSAPLTSPVVGDDLTAQNDTSAPNQTRTFQYRKLKGGYAVYARLENDVVDKDAASSAQKDQPLLPGTYAANGISGFNVYLIKR